MERLRDAIHRVLAAIKNMHIFQKCETRQHVGRNDKLGIDYLSQLFEPRGDIQDIAHIGDLALAVAAFPRNDGSAMKRRSKSGRHAEAFAVD